MTDQSLVPAAEGLAAAFGPIVTPEALLAFLRSQEDAQSSARLQALLGSLSQSADAAEGLGNSREEVGELPGLMASIKSDADELISLALRRTRAPEEAEQLFLAKVAATLAAALDHVAARAARAASGAAGLAVAASPLPPVSASDEALLRRELFVILTAIEDAPEVAGREPTPWADAWRRLRRERALACGFEAFCARVDDLTWELTNNDRRPPARAAHDCPASDAGEAL